MTELTNIEANLGTVEKKVRAIAATLKDYADYKFMNWAQANIELDKTDKPAIIYILPASGKLEFGWREIIDKPESQIAFVSSTDYDFDGDVNDGVIEHMKRLLIRFVIALNNSGLFEQIEGDVPYRVIYDMLDQNVTGIIAEIPLKETDGIMLCNGELRSEDITEEG